MKKTLRKRFVFFAMSAVTILLTVLISAINIFSWMLLDRQSDDILHALSEGEAKFTQKDRRDRGAFLPPMSMDTVSAARFFMVRTDAAGNVLYVNTDHISSVTAEQTVQYAAAADGDAGKVGVYKYRVKHFGADRLIFFMDVSSQRQIFMMVLSLSCAIAALCWIAVMIFVIPFSGRVVRPILAGMEKQKQFITNAGHELKTPLAIIQSNNDASALICGETKYSKNIRQQTKRLNALMSNMLTLSKLDEDMSLPTENISISGMVLDLMPAYEDAAAQRALGLSVHVEPEIFLPVHADTFSQMIIMLLDNAVKYTPEGGLIRVALRKCGARMELTVENPCPQRPAADPERLFERFYRGSSARTQDGSASGYGIGLSAARAIAELFGGKLTCEYTQDDSIRFIARF